MFASIIYVLIYYIKFLCLVSLSAVETFINVSVDDGRV